MKTQQRQVLVDFGQVLWSILSNEVFVDKKVCGVKPVFNQPPFYITISDHEGGLALLFLRKYPTVTQLISQCVTRVSYRLEFWNCVISNNDPGCSGTEDDSVDKICANKVTKCHLWHFELGTSWKKNKEDISLTDITSDFMVWVSSYFRITWWRHQMETFSALLAFCAVN